ncbi:MAG: hypothetical protein AMS21_02695 [Gemmatimonas sp. SG8_38_2]|nr:MAG: hypothetical protein AMS21_02695 [Gemmatimonas sp. SG8_38_2]
MSLELVPRTQSRDVSGFGVFAHGDAGAAHVMAHRMLDEERHELGHQLLGAWLDRHEGAGSDWTHLQWHMAVFEIAVGRWDAALDRFEREILPVATSSADALTDAPAMLWRLWLTVPREVDLPWEPVRSTAVQNLGKHDCPYVELHCLLALAGARDVETLDHWLRIKRGARGERAKLLVRLVAGLRAFATNDQALAASILASCTPRIAELGGSQAQNRLFEEIADYCWQRATERAAA